MKEVMLALHQKPIAYYPVYRDITGSTTAAILLSQLLYWYSACKGKKFYKTDSEIMEETRLTEKELRNAKSCLKKFDFIIIELEGLPRRTFYSFNETNLHRLLVQYSNAQRAELETPKGRSNNSPKGEAITENTKEHAKNNSERGKPAPKKSQLETENNELEISDGLKYELEAYKKAARVFCEIYLDLNPDWKNAKFALPYFQNAQQKGKWFELQIPTNATDKQRWLGQHLSGIDRWAAMEPKFNPQKNGNTATIPGGYKIPKPNYSPEQ